MKWIYAVAGIVLFVKILIMPNPAAEWEEISIVESIVKDSGVPNAVSGIIFRNRLYDTIFESLRSPLQVLSFCSPMNNPPKQFINSAIAPQLCWRV